MWFILWRNWNFLFCLTLTNWSRNLKSCTWLRTAALLSAETLELQESLEASFLVLPISEHYVQLFPYLSSLWFFKKIYLQMLLLFLYIFLCHTFTLGSSMYMSKAVGPHNLRWFNFIQCISGSLSTLTRGTVLRICKPSVPEWMIGWMNKQMNTDWINEWQSWGGQQILKHLFKYLSSEQ